MPSAVRYVIDEEATAELRAEQLLWLPALIPASEPAYDLALVIDDSESMALWQQKVREFRLLCEQLGAFRDVRQWQLSVSRDGTPGKPALRGAASRSGTHDERELLDPSGRRLILVVTDGVHPWWQPAGPLRPVLARWALSSPLAIVQPFPQRLWARSLLRPVAREFRPGWPGSGPTILHTDHGSASVTVPILELTDKAFGLWAGIISATAGPTDLAATVLPRKHAPDPEPAGPAPPRNSTKTRPKNSTETAAMAAERLVREFRRSASPAAYQLAGYLSAAPLTLPVMRLVQESMMPETGPTELAEVFLSGLLRRSAEADQANGDGAQYVLAAGVRDVLQSMLTRDEALDVLTRVGSYLVKGRRAGPSFPFLLESDAGAADIVAAAERFPSAFGRISRMLLERIGGPYAQAIQQATETTPVVEKPRTGRPVDWIFDNAGFSGRLYQPMLFVGLGGTGCEVGVELERRMRDAICGVDGNHFRNAHARENMEAYQLPSCVQFVYADLDQGELGQLPHRVVPDSQDLAPVGFTAQYVSGLIPDLPSYPVLATRLRLRASEEVLSWLPPPTPDEPKVAPLSRGAGQLPTIGRAALFSNVVDGDGTGFLVRQLREAAGRLATSGEDVHALGGRPPRGVEVFVAFSVAGGTGAGLFYDYLHLIADTIRAISDLQVRIYPLVLMPSAFPEELGGGRLAELNAGRALVDLFRLVDQQNGAEARHELRGAHDPRPVDRDDGEVVYPKHERLSMRPGTMQTALLFSQSAGAVRDDLHRMMTTLILSLAGTEPPDEYYVSGGSRHSFAESFVGAGAHRQMPAEDGIGLRGLSTALTTTLSVPADELADIVAGRLLREAVREIATQDPNDSTGADIEEFLSQAGVRPVFQRRACGFSEPPPANGARDVTVALDNRRESMLIGIDALGANLRREVPPIASRFSPDTAASHLLGRMDVFRLQRVAFGNPGHGSDLERGGAAGLLRSRAAGPEVPSGLDPAPPTAPELHDRFGRRMHWDEDKVLDVRRQQDAWYQWQTHLEWAQAWKAHEGFWSPPIEKLKRDLSAITRSLNDFARQDANDFTHRWAELNRQRTGTSYLLPFGAEQPEDFYHAVYTRLTARLAQSGTVPFDLSAAGMIQTLAGPDAWTELYSSSLTRSPEFAVGSLREKVRLRIKEVLRERRPRETWMLPRLHDLLAKAAGHGQASRPDSEIPRDYVDRFAAKLAAFIPADFCPQGHGPLKLLVNYPADAPNDAIIRYLKSAINFPTEPNITEEFRAIKSESISAVLLRTHISLTEVDEVRRVLRRWADAQTRPEPTDLLRWRQRTGYDIGYVVTQEDHRVRILHRLLCAMWNGRVTVTGPVESPTRIRIEVYGGVMTLSLASLGSASSWARLLNAYELWALDDDDQHRWICGRLMSEFPIGLDGRPQPPDELYVTIRGIAAGQVELLDEMLRAPLGEIRGAQEDESQSRLVQARGFWARTLPAALDVRFNAPEAPVARNLRELEELIGNG